MVEWKKIGEVSNILYGYPFESSLFTEDSNHMPLIRIRDIKPAKASTYYLGACIDEYRIKKGDILVGMDGEFNLGRWNDRDGLLNQRVLKLTGKKGCCIAGYLYHYMGPVFKKIEKSTAGGSVKHLSAKVINNILIPIPSLEEQERIVGILDTFNASIDNIKAQIEQRRKQYEHYRNTLLTFNKDDDSVEWKTLGEVAEIGTGSGNTNEGLTEGLYPFYTRGQEILRKNEYEYDEQAVVTAGDGVGVGKVIHYVEGKYALHQRAYRFCPKKNLNTKFLFYYMKVTFYKYVCGNAVASSVSSLRKPKLQVYPIPIPTLARQQEIVSILDTFEASITNLEAQLEQRQKQYEYYREELLTF